MVDVCLLTQQQIYYPQFKILLSRPTKAVPVKQLLKCTDRSVGNSHTVNGHNERQAAEQHANKTVGNQPHRYAQNVGNSHKSMNRIDGKQPHTVPVGMHRIEGNSHKNMDRIDGKQPHRYAPS